MVNHATARARGAEWEATHVHNGRNYSAQWARVKRLLPAGIAATAAAGRGIRWLVGKPKFQGNDRRSNLPATEGSTNVCPAQVPPIALTRLRARGNSIAVGFGI
jgi:hypothetical protein